MLVRVFNSIEEKRLTKHSKTKKEGEKKKKGNIDFNISPSNCVQGLASGISGIT